MGVRRSLALSLLQRYVAVAVYLVTTVVIARLLTPTEIGVYSLCAAVVTITSTLREFGVSEYLIQERQLTTDKIRSAYGVAIGVGWLAGVGVLMVRHPLAQFYGEPGIADILAVLSVNFFLLPLATPAFALLAREMAFSAIVITQVISAVVGSTITVYLAWQGHSYMSLAWGTIATNIAQLIGVMVVRPRDSWMLPAMRGSRVVWTYCFAYTGTTLVDIAARHTRDFILARQFDFGAVGLYSRAHGVLEQLLGNITSAISRVVTPALALDNRSGQPLGQRYGQAVGIFTVIAWPVCGFAAAAAPDIVRVLLGPQWAEAVPLVRLLCIASAVGSVCAFAPNVLAALGNVRARLRIALVVSPLVVALYLLGSIISVQAVALLSAVPVFVSLLMYSRYVERLIGFALRDVVHTTRISAIVTLLALVPVIMMNYYVPPNLVGIAAYLIAKASAAAAVWLAAIVLLNHPLKTELVKIAWSIRRRPTSK